MFEPKAAISPAGSPTEFKAGKVDMNEFVKSIDLNRCSDVSFNIISRNDYLPP
jgi:hypothetical protein